MRTRSDSDSDSDDQLAFPPSSGANSSISTSQLSLKPRPRRHQPSFFLPPPSQRSSTSTSNRTSKPTSIPGLLPPPSQSRSSSSTSRPSTSSRPTSSHPVGVPRPPTARRSLLASSSSSRLDSSSALRETQAKSDQSSQESDREQERRHRARTTAEAKEKEGERAGGDMERVRKKVRSTTPCGSPPPPPSPPGASQQSIFLPPPSQSRSRPRPQPPQASTSSLLSLQSEPPKPHPSTKTKVLRPVPVIPPSSFRVAEASSAPSAKETLSFPVVKAARGFSVGGGGEGVGAGREGKAVLREVVPVPSPSSPSPKKRPRSPSPQRGFSRTLLASLRSLDPSFADPSNLYGTHHSLLFRVEMLERGGVSWAQGGRKGYGRGLMEGKKRRIEGEEDEGRNDFPSWAKTPDGAEWESSLLSRLSTRLSTASKGTGGEDEDFIALLQARDISRLKQVRLGGDAGGGVECYLVRSTAGSAEGGVGKGAGRERERTVEEFPCRNVVVVGWVVAEGEWREKEGGWSYTIDDGTALLDVFCPSSTGPDDPHPPSSAFSLLNPASKLPPRAAPPPSVDPRTSAISTASLAPFLESASSAAAIAAITARHADLEERARDAGSEETRVGRGRLVRVVGRVEEGRYEWMRGKEGEGRRVVASRIDVLTSLTAETSHHLLVARLHKEVYSRPFNLRERLEAIERRRRERKRDAQEVSMMSSTAGGSSYAGDVSMSSVGSSSAGGREKKFAPPRPSKLAREDLTLSNFMAYIRRHLIKNYVKTHTPSAPPPPSHPSSSSSSSLHFPSFSSPSSSPSVAAAATNSIAYATPFSLPLLRSNPNLNLFATRLAQERARVKAEKEREVRERRGRLGPLGAVMSASTHARGGGQGRAWVAAPTGGGTTGGVGQAARGRVVKGAAGLLLPPPSSASSFKHPSSASHNAAAGPSPYASPRSILAASRTSASTSSSSSRPAQETAQQTRARLRAERDALRNDGPLEAGEELERETERVWKEALRTMRGKGEVVQFEYEAEAVMAEKEKVGWARGGRGGRDAGWEVDFDEAEGLPDEPSWGGGGGAGGKGKAKQGDGGGCPWGEVQFGGSSDQEDDGEGRKKKEKKGEATPRAVPSGGGCPWGDIKLGSDDDNEQDVVLKTPTAKRTKSLPRSSVSATSSSKTARPPSAAHLASPSSRPSLSSSSSFGRRPSLSAGDTSTSSILTTGSLAYDPSDPSSGPFFQLITPQTLLPLLSTLLLSLYASNGGKSVTEHDVREALAREEKWEAVGRFGKAVGEGLELLTERGEAQRYGGGWRPV